MSRDDRSGDQRGGKADEDERRRNGAAGNHRRRRDPGDDEPRARDRDRTPGGGHRQRGDSTVRRLLAGGVGGAVTFLLGWMVTLTALSGSFVREGKPIPMYDDLFQFGTIPEWKAALWYFHGGHFGQMQKYGEQTVPETGTYQNLIRILVDDASHLASFVLPIVLLLVAGFVLAWILGADQTGRGAVAGASLVVGYLALAVVAGVLVGVSGESYSLGAFWPSLLLLTGLAYPLSFGGLGGAIAGRLR